MKQKTIELYKFMKKNSGYIVGESSKGALAMAKRLEISLTLDFTIKWDWEQDYSIGDLGDYQTEAQFRYRIDNGLMEVLCLAVECEDFSEHLGIITVNPHSNDTEDYKRMMELDLIDQLYDQVKKGA